LARSHNLAEEKAFFRSAPLDGMALAKRHERSRDLEDIFAFYAELLTGAPPDPAWRKRLLGGLGPKAKVNADTVGAGIALVAASPET
jgi:hypothetical protein